MQCPKCGQAVAGNSRVCSRCGAQLPLSGGLPSPVGAAPAGIYAGFWKRLAAFILDYAVVLVLAMLAGGVIGLIAGAGAGVGAAPSASDDDPAAGLGAVAGLLVWWLYYALMESSEQQATLGKLALGIRVVDMQGNRVSFWRATARNAAKLLSGMILAIGYLIAGFTARKQALHDIIAGCLVVNRAPAGGRTQDGLAVAGMPAWAVVVIVLAALIFPAAILAAIALPAYQDYLLRTRTALAFQVGQRATQAVETYYARNNVLPRDLREAGLADAGSRDIREVKMNPANGTVTVVLATPPLEGKSIQFVPERDGSNRVVWICRGEGVPARYLPPNCRPQPDQPPGRK